MFALLVGKKLAADKALRATRKAIAAPLIRAFIVSTALILASKAGAKTPVIDASSTQQNVANNAPKPVPNQAQKDGSEGPVVAQVTRLPGRVLASAESDRIQILLSERQRVLERLAQLVNSSERKRLRSDLAALDKELKASGYSPTAPSSTPPDFSQAQQGPAPAMTAAPPAVSPPQHFESWDIFKNFGSRGNK